jgi:hypothetical protein
MITRDNRQFIIPNTGNMSWEELEKVFPDYFKTGASFKGVLLAMSDQLKKMGFTQDFKKQIPQYPQARNVSRTSLVNMDGVEHEFCYINRSKQDNLTGNITAASEELRYLRLEKGKCLEASEKEMLWYLWFCSNEMLNNANPIKSQGARLNFVFAEREAQTKNASMLRIGRLSASILDEEVMDFESLVDVARSVGYSTVGLSNSELRHELMQRATSNAEFAEELTEAIKRYGKDDILFNIKKAIGIANERNGIKLDKRPGRGWYYTEDEVHILKTNNSEDYEEQLARYLLSDKDAQASFLDKFK